MSDLAVQLEKLILRLAARKMKRVIRATAEDYVRDAVRIAADDVLEEIDLPAQVLNQLQCLGSNQQFVEKVREAVEFVLERELAALIEKRVHLILLSEEMQAWIDQLVVSRIQEAFQSVETTSKLEGIVKALITASVERMSQQLLNSEPAQRPHSSGDDGRILA